MQIQAAFPESLLKTKLLCKFLSQVDWQVAVLKNGKVNH